MSTATGIQTAACSPACLRAGEWLLGSGIQEPQGGVARYHWIAERRNARVSTEITGYAVSALVELHERSGEVRFLDAARKSGDFLCRAWDASCAAMPFEWPLGDGAEPLTFFFDNGIIARGLLRLWRATGTARYLDIARACAEAMERDFLNCRDIHPVLRLPSKEPADRDGRWSRSSGCYQLKSALAWLDLADIAGDARYRPAFDKALELALATHRSFVDAAPDDRARMDRLHAYCYFLEGLFARPEDARVREALREGIAFTGSELRRIRPEFERSDVNAQLLRIRLWADALGIERIDEAAAEEEAMRLASFQMEGGGPMSGGFNFGALHGAPTNYANPVSTVFGMQALAMWDEYCNGGLRTAWHRLI
ncbi:MAG: hypothetical protein NZR01_06125 [Bryobacteraceae bacterium]|nr:hypothetical protein [Bryobacteraceae bacterium]